jgi:hypothetical protein
MSKVKGKGKGKMTPVKFWTLDFGLWTLDFGLWTLGLWNLEFGIWNLEFGLIRVANDDVCSACGGQTTDDLGALNLCQLSSGRVPKFHPKSAGLTVDGER